MQLDTRGRIKKVSSRSDKVDKINVQKDKFSNLFRNVSLFSYVNLFSKNNCQRLTKDKNHLSLQKVEDKLQKQIRKKEKF